MNVEFLMAARKRIVYNGHTKLAGAMLDKPDDDDLVTALETVSQRHRGDSNKPAIDAIEIAIAELVDAGQALPITNPEAYQAAQWLATGNLDSLPDPIPRAFVLYFAKAWADNGVYASMKAALTAILNTRTFV